MRIIGGQFKGTRLATLGKGDAEAHLRPTSDRVRENIFNLLINGGYGDPLTGVNVLDLFAGTGALGLEALSRGAASVTFVDDGATAAALIRQNIDLCHARDRARLLRRNATKPNMPMDHRFDLIFLDPPYGKGLGQQALKAVTDSGWLNDQALVVWEDNARQIAPPRFEMLDARRYGGTWVHLLATKPAP